jgi:hypothetical protein
MITTDEILALAPGAVISDYSGRKHWVVRHVSYSQLPFGVIAIVQLQRDGDPRTLSYLVTRWASQVQFWQDLTKDADLSGTGTTILHSRKGDAGDCRPP